MLGGWARAYVCMVLPGSLADTLVPLVTSCVPEGIVPVSPPESPGQGLGQGRASAAGLRGDLLRLTHLWEILWGEAGQVPSGTREKSTTHCGLFQPKRLVPRSAGLRAQCRGRVELPGLLLH